LMDEHHHEESPQHYIESATERFADDYWEVSDLTPPLDIQNFSLKFGIILRREYLGLRLSGLCFVTPNNNRYAIVNSLEHPHRQRFVSIHECAHLLFDDLQPVEMRLDLQHDKRQCKLERRADQLSAAMLMPYQWVRRWWDELATNPQCRVYIMAERFGVSKQAMRIRLRELGYKLDKWDR